MFENRVLRRIFGPKRDEVTGDWRKLHNEELNDLYCSLNIFSGDVFVKNKTGGACCCQCEKERGIQSFGGET